MEVLSIPSYRAMKRKLQTVNIYWRIYFEKENGEVEKRKKKKNFDSFLGVILTPWSKDKLFSFFFSF